MARRIIAERYSVPVAMRYGREQVAVFAQGDASDGPYTCTRLSAFPLLAT